MNKSIEVEPEQMTCREASYESIRNAGFPYFPCFGESKHPFTEAASTLLRELCDEYRAGSWSYMELSNGAWYVYPLDCETMFLKDGDGALHRMSPDGVGLAVTAYLVNHLQWMYHEEGQTEESMVASDHFYKLRDFFFEHRDAAAIWNIVD